MDLHETYLVEVREGEDRARESERRRSRPSKRGGSGGRGEVERLRRPSPIRRRGRREPLALFLELVAPGREPPKRLERIRSRSCLQVPATAPSTRNVGTDQDLGVGIPWTGAPRGGSGWPGRARAAWRPRWEVAGRRDRIGARQRGPWDVDQKPALTVAKVAQLHALEGVRDRAHRYPDPVCHLGRRRRPESWR